MTNSELKLKLSKSVDFFKSELTKIRTGRAAPSLIEDIPVDAYDAKMTVKELGSVTLLDSQMLLVAPWDKNLAKDISKAVFEAGLGLNPVVDGGNVRIPIPPLTSERRAELVKIVSGQTEEAKISIRDIRQAAMKDIDKDFAEKSISEDDKFALKEEVEKTVKDVASQIDELSDSKKEELLKV